jgi:hypothetical protein
MYYILQANKLQKKYVPLSHKHALVCSESVFCKEYKEYKAGFRK